jgi:hypothetical protein
LEGIHQIQSALPCLHLSYIPFLKREMLLDGLIVFHLIESIVTWRYD